MVSFREGSTLVSGAKPFGGRRHVIGNERGQVAEIWTWPDGRVFVARVLTVVA